MMTANDLIPVTVYATPWQDMWELRILDPDSDTLITQAEDAASIPREVRDYLATVFDGADFSGIAIDIRYPQHAG